MTEEYPPKDAYDSHKLRKLLNKAVRQIEQMDDPTGIILPTESLAQTLEPLLRDDLLVLAPHNDGWLLDVSTQTVYDKQKKSEANGVIDLRLATRHADGGDTDLIR